MLNDVFPYKVCINLDRRADRWERMQQTLARHGIEGVRRFAALDGETLNVPAHWRHTAGAYGCLRSHVEVVSEARRAGAPSVLIFEDDVVLDPDLHQKFESRFRQLPDDWDMVFFGALHKDQPMVVSEHMVRLTKSNSTYAYAVRDRIFDAFIELNSRADDVLDNNSFLLQERYNCYCFMPHLAWVETDFSDAQKKLERHWYLKESLVLFSAEVDRLLAKTTIVFAHDGRSPESLLYLVRYYHAFFSPYVAIVVVEQGARPSIDEAVLPEGCRYVFLRDEGPFDRQRCFEIGISYSSPDRHLLVLSDGDIYLETLDFRGNLRMCERYDAATGFEELIDLTPEASRQLRVSDTTRGLDVAAGRVRENDGRRCYFVNRDALRRPEERRRLFHSPNHALRLA